MVFLIEIDGKMPMEREAALPPTAFRVPVRRVDERRFASAAEYDAKLVCPQGASSAAVAKWLEEGEGHRDTTKGIARDFTDSAWLVEYSEEELKLLLQMTGSVIRGPRPDYPDFLILDIIPGRPDNG